MSPHGLVPPIKRSRVSGHLVIVGRVITVITGYFILSYIIKPVAAERVAAYGGMLPKYSGFPIYFACTITLSNRSKKWPIFAKIGSFLFRSRDTPLL